MAKSEVEEVTHKTLQKGGLLVKIYFDMASEKKEDLQPLMVDMINNRLLKTPGVVYAHGAIEDPIKTNDVYTTSSILTVLVNDFKVLVNICFMFSPAGIEILKPDRDYTLKINDMQAILLSLSQIAADYSQYILTKVMSKEDMEKMKRDMANREALGKRLLKKNEEPHPPE